MVPFESLGTVSYSHSIVTIGPILYHFRDKARYWLKITNFSYHSLHSMPPLQGSPLEYCHNIWHGKTRMAYRWKSLRICLAVSTDGRADNMLCTASRGKNEAERYNNTLNSSLYRVTVKKFKLPRVRIELTTSAYLCRTLNVLLYKYGALTDCATGAPCEPRVSYVVICRNNFKSMYYCLRILAWIISLFHNLAKT